MERDWQEAPSAAEWSLLQSVGVGVEVAKTAEGWAHLMASISGMKLGAISSYPLRVEMKRWVESLRRMVTIYELKGKSCEVMLTSQLRLITMNSFWYRISKLCDYSLSLLITSEGKGRQAKPSSAGRVQPKSKRSKWVHRKQLQVNDLSPNWHMKHIWQGVLHRKWKRTETDLVCSEKQSKRIKCMSDRLYYVLFTVQVPSPFAAIWHNLCQPPSEATRLESWHLS